MPVKFCPFVAVIMCDELGEDRGVFSKKDKILESKIKSIFWSAEVVITGKCGRELELSEKLSVKIELFLPEERFFFYARTIDEDLVSIR